MVVEFKAKVTATKLSANFGALRHSVQDLRPVIEPFLSSFFKLSADVFANQGKRPGSRAQAWKPLAKGTIKNKARMAARGKISSANVWRPNIRTGRLLRSLTIRGGENVFTVTKRTGKFGTKSPRAYQVQHGLRAARVGVRGGYIPARKIVKITPADRDRFLNALADYIAKGGKTQYILERGKRSIIYQRQSAGLDE